MVSSVFLLEEPELREELEIAGVATIGLKPIEVFQREKIPATSLLCQAHEQAGEDFALHSAEDATEADALDHCWSHGKVPRGNRPIGADFIPATLDVRPQPVFPVAPDWVTENNLLKPLHRYCLHPIALSKKGCETSVLIGLFLVLPYIFIIHLFSRLVKSWRISCNLQSFTFYKIKQYTTHAKS